MKTDKTKTKQSEQTVENAPELMIESNNSSATIESRLKNELRYLQLLAKSFPTAAKASTEIINLEAILNLPKGTEHFLTDIHGEYEAFQHVLKNASGTVKRKVNEIFGNTLREDDKKQLCTLIYYPRETLRLTRQREKNIEEWYSIMLNRLIKVCQSASSKYTRSKVQKALPAEFSYIIQELLHETVADPNKAAYFNQIISTIITTDCAESFIIAICEVIQRLVIDSLHIVGDIYDRGPGAHIIMDTLCDYHNVDVQWGNHDLLWMGAMAGNDACIANVLRISLRYANLETLEKGYGINLLPLATMAIETYTQDDLSVYMPKVKNTDRFYSAKEQRIIAQMHKAISVIQWKIEADIIRRNPRFGMEDRMLLHKVDYEAGTLNINGETYPLIDKIFPTIDPADPYRLTEEEQSIVDYMHDMFIENTQLTRHTYFMLTHGSFYLARNNNLMFHASIPMNEDGTFKSVEVMGEHFSGRSLLDRLNRLVQVACRGIDDVAEEERTYAVDFMWYLWCGPDSPSFDKSKMATFERYLTTDKVARHEEKGFYYKLHDSEDVCNKILREFGLPTTGSHIINGHVPVKTIKGENPVKANGKLLVIDGGFSRAYQTETGIAGYTLVFHSRGLQLVQHQPFESRQKAIEESQDIISNTVLQEFNSHRMLVRDTDKGKELAEQVRNLTNLLDAYRLGLIRERR